MARDLVVPKFGNWDDGGNVQYTAYFERARNGKKTDFEAARPVARANEVNRRAYYSRGLEAAASLNPRISGDCARKSMRSPLRPDALRVLAGTGTSHLHNDGPRPRHHRGGVAGETSSPLRERRRRYSSDISEHRMPPPTPERLRVKPVLRGEEAPDHGNSVPKFGDWDEGSPSAGEGYTEIFNRVIDQKQSGGTEIIPTRAGKSLPSSYNDSCDNRSARVCCCLPWRRRSD